MTKFRIGCKLGYRVRQPASFVFNIALAENAYQRLLREDLCTDPALPLDEFTSPQTRNRYHRLHIESGRLEIAYEATVEVSPFRADPREIAEIPPATLPSHTLDFIYPSRYCPSDRFIETAWEQFGALKPGYARVVAICDWIHQCVAYVPGASNQHTSACDTLQERRGICRDFAHLGIAFCRALNIPARFVSVYAHGLEMPDFHACFEAYLGDRWYLFDATRKVPLEHLVRIGTGRDAADVSFATIFGASIMESMCVFAEPLSNTVSPDASASKVALSTI